MKRFSLPERPVQVDDLLVEVVPDDHVEGANGSATVSCAAVRIFFGLKGDGIKLTFSKQFYGPVR